MMADNLKICSVQLQAKTNTIGPNIEIPCLQTRNQPNQKQIVTKYKL